MLRTPGLSNTQKIPVFFIILVAFALHGPFLIMQRPANSYDANFHISMAAHYAHHWFNPWNESSLAGFSETTYPPLTHQWIALLSHAVGLLRAYLLFQLIIILLLPLAVYRYARLWVDERSASYAALGSVFIGALWMLVYEDGQLATTSSTTLFLLAIPFFYSWAVDGKGRDLVKGLVIGFAASAAHHATTIFGSVLFVVPVIWLACMDHRKVHPEESLWQVFRRIGIFLGLAFSGICLVLLPYIASLIKHPINQVPIWHQSRSNMILQPFWGLHYQVIGMGALLLLIPYVFWRGAGDRRLRPLFVGFWLTWLFGLGGTTPLPRWLVGRAFDVLTFERFTFWALLMMLPIVGLLASSLIRKYGKTAAIALATASIAGAAMAFAWNTYFTLISPHLQVGEVINFLNTNGHDKYRYITLGFGNSMSEVASHTTASSVDGEYNSARTLPEMTTYGSAQLTSSKYYGIAGITSLTAILKHAPRYGLKYIFCHDPYYEPLLVFGGWRQIDTFNQGDITVWTTIGIPPAHEIPSDMIPPRWQGIMWGILPFGSSIAAIIVVFLIPEPRKRRWDTDDSDQAPRVAAEEPVESYASAPTGTTGGPPRTRQKISLITAFPPGRGDLNEYGYHLARVLNANPQVELTVLADVMEQPAPELPDFYVQRCWKFNAVSNLFRLVRAVRKSNPDVVWFNIGLSSMANRPVAAFVNTALPALLSLLGYNTHVTLHAFFENVDLSHANLRFPALYRFGGNLATRILLRANGVHVLLPSYGRALQEKYKVAPGRIHVHSHGVFALEIQPPTLNNSTRILAFGSWGTYKRLEGLLAALSIVQKEVPQAELVVAGGDHPKARGYIESLRKQYEGNDSIRFLGYVPESRLPGLFRNSALAVLPYDSGAGSSGVAHIAAENGLPIVAADLPDFTEMAHWEGLAVEFYPRGDVHGLAQAILRVLSSQELREHMAAQNAAAASKITFDRLVGEYLESFQVTLQREKEFARRSQEIREQPGFAVNRGATLNPNQIQEIR